MLAAAKKLQKLRGVVGAELNRDVPGSLADASIAVGEGPVSAMVTHVVSEGFTFGAHRVFRGIPAGDPHFSTQSNNRLPSHHRVIGFVFADKVGEPVTVSGSFFTFSFSTFK